MRLDQCEIRPGKVLQVIDNYGHVKASCAGIFSEQDDPDLLPPMSQFFKVSANQFSQPHVGDDIYVFIFADNPQLFLYVFQGDTNIGEADGLDNEYDDVDITMMRNTGSGSVRVGYDTDNGYAIKNNDTRFNIDNDSNAFLEHKSGNTISVTEKNISLGKKKKSRYHAVAGEELISVLKDIRATLDAIKNSASGSPYTTQISAAMTPLMGNLSSFDNILSDVVTLEKS